MRKSIIFAIMAMAALTFAITSCNSEETAIDPIHGTIPVDSTWWSGINESTRFPLDQFKEFGRENDTLGQRALVDEYRKVLTKNVVRHYPQISNEGNIHFVLGSGFAKDVKSGDGKTYSGSFRNELIIIIDDPRVKDTLFLACGNGMLSPLEFSSQSNFGQGDPWIEVEANDSYAKYFPDTWGELAKDADVGIRNEKGEMVTPRIYLNYLGKYVSMLRPGDKINLITGEVRDENWKVVSFESRQSDTEKANAKAKAKVKSTKKPQKGKRR